MDLRKAFKRYRNVVESFVHKTRSKKNTDLISKPSFVLEDGVYILHEVLGVKTVDGWNPDDNEGVVGILLIEDEHKIVIALEDAPEDLIWSKERKLVNEPVEFKDVDFDFKGEEHCRNLNSPKFPAAYYCLNYKKGGRSWYLPSYGELRMILRHLDEIQNALETVGGQKFVFSKDNYWNSGSYWSSTESTHGAWYWHFVFGASIENKDCIKKVRPVFKFGPSVLRESFTRKISSRKNTELISKTVETFIPDGVYILHQTLGVRTVDGWNPEDNEGVVGILLVEDEHQIVIALEDSPKKLYWSKDCKLINRPVDGWEDAVSDFNGEKYCRNLNSPEYPAAYYCLKYKKGGRDWYLPSAGELWLICRHLEEVQTALSIVGGEKFVTTWKANKIPWYWSSTERSYETGWPLNFFSGDFNHWCRKAKDNKVRPVSNFRQNPLKESFTKKISSKKNTDLISKPSFVLEDGVYILHETLGVRGVKGWKPKFNNGVIGILVVEDEHQIVVALEEKEFLTWSKKPRKVNQSIKDIEDAKSDFNGEEYCKNLNSPDFPAAYYCLNYKKGDRNWYLPSSGELLLVRRHLEEIQSALSIVGGQKFVTDWKGVGMPLYWSSTEYRAFSVWNLNLYGGYIEYREKVSHIGNVRPIFKFQPSELKESFTKKIKSVRKSDLTSKPSFVLDDGVYILHETLGVQSVEGWNKKFNEGVIGILVVSVEDEKQIVIALENSPKKLHWSEEKKLVNRPVEDIEVAESDFNGEEYCKNLDSPEFPAAYYCLNYNKGGRNWHLPSAGELLMIYWYIEEIDAALSIVGGQKFDAEWNDVFWDRKSWYWSSTEQSENSSWSVNLYNGTIDYWPEKVREIQEVRPISKFQPSELKESFTKKISSKRNTDLIPDMVYTDGVYIFHKTLGVKTVEEWNKKFNKGVVGILVVDDDHKFVVALEDSPDHLIWSKEWKLINRPIEDIEVAESDFNGEEYCKNLNSPDFPAAYYCLNYNKDNRSWYLPSTGELKSIYRYLGEIQNALSIVGGQKFISDWNCVGMPWYWSSTESGNVHAWFFDLADGILRGREPKVSGYPKVRPISKFQSFELKESFAKKIVSRIEESFVDKIKKSSEKSLIDKSEEVFDIYLDLKKFVFENSFTFTDGWYYFDIKDFDSIPVCHEFLDDLEINDYNEYLYTYGNILLKKGKSWKDSKLMVEINKSDSSELYDDVVKTVPWDYLSDYQGEQKRIVDCLLET